MTMILALFFQSAKRFGTCWPDDDFHRTHTMKMKRQDVLTMLPTIRKRVGA